MGVVGIAVRAFGIGSPVGPPAFTEGRASATASGLVAVPGVGSPAAAGAVVWPTDVGGGAPRGEATTIGGATTAGEAAARGESAATGAATTTGDAAATGGAATARGGSREAGSTYPSAAEETLMPRCTYGFGHSDSPVCPATPIASPSATDAPFPVVISPRWVTDTV